MKSHLNIKFDGHDVTLPEDFSMNFHEKNPLFHDVEMFSEPAPIDVEENRFILDCIDVPESGKRPIDFERKPMDVEIDGIPVRHGVSRVNDNTPIDGSLDLNMDASTQSFDDLIGDLNCQDVPLKDELMIGQKIGEVKVDVSYVTRLKVKYQDGKKQDTEYGSTDDVKGSATFEPQALGFSYPGIATPDNGGYVNGIMVSSPRQRTYPDGTTVRVPNVQTSFINVSSEYGSTVNSPYKDENNNPIGWPFCNSRVAYMHKGINEDGTSSDSVIKKGENENVYESMYPYWVLDADRQQSGICFYVLYFLDCLFKHLGVTFDNSELLEIEDLKRLAFFTTHCHYYTKRTWDSPIATFNGSDNGLTIVTESIHTMWIHIDGIGFKYGSEEETLEKANENVFGDINKWLEDRGCGGSLKVSKPKTKSLQNFTYKDKQTGVVQEIKVGDDVAAIEMEAWIKDLSCSAYLQDMYATSENFPDESVKTVLNSLEKSFGIRFQYDYERKHVKAYVMRNVFRRQGEPRKIGGEVLSIIPKVDMTSGIRMKYSNEGTDKDQRQNIKKGIRDYDTDYDYIDYPAPDSKGDKTIVMDSLADIKATQRANNNNVYIDRTTGNAYRWKIDKDALASGDVRINLFEVGQFKGVTLGDCSESNEDHIVEYVSDFVPVPFNNVTATMEEDMASGGTITYNNRYEFSNINGNFVRTYAPYIDEDMEHEFVEQHIDNLIASVGVDVYCTEVLKLIESYDPTSTDDGNSPLQHYDWGLAVAIMRGGGNNMTIQHYDYNYDNFSNSKWKTVAGDYAMSSDSMTPEGEDYDYNGTEEGDGSGERLSLKIRAYKQPEWSDVPLCDNDVISGTEIVRRIKSRGLADTMMAELFYFILNRKPLQITLRMTPAELIDLPNHWRERVEIDGMIGFMDEIEYSVSLRDGLSDVKLLFYYI